MSSQAVDGTPRYKDAGEWDDCCLDDDNCEVGVAEYNGDIDPYRAQYEADSDADSDAGNYESSIETATRLCFWHAEMAFCIEQQDPLSFISSYGVDPAVAHKICDHATIAALTAHGDDLRIKTIETTDAYEDAFQAFVKTLKDHGYPRRWMREFDSPVFAAYCDFMQARRTELKRVERPKSKDQAS